VGVLAFAAAWTIVFEIQFFASLFGWLWSGYLPFEGVGKVAAEAIFAVSHIIMNAWIETSIYVSLSTISFAFIDSKVLISANILNHF
jgi:hypothetical protein